MTNSSKGHFDSFINLSQITTFSIEKLDNQPQDKRLLQLAWKCGHFVSQLTDGMVWLQYRPYATGICSPSCGKELHLCILLCRELSGTCAMGRVDCIKQSCIGVGLQQKVQETVKESPPKKQTNKNNNPDRESKEDKKETVGQTNERKGSLRSGRAQIKQ